MRRVFIPLVVVPVLLLAMAAPVAAAPPMRESGTQEYLFAFSSDCGRSTCTDTLIDAFSVDNETVVVCLNQFTYSIRNGRVTSEQGGCTETSSSALTVTSSFSATLSPTSVQVCGGRRCNSVTVSAALSSTGGPIYTDSGRGTFSDGTCTYRYSFSGQSTEVAGTLTVDGVTLDAWGSAGFSEYRVSIRC